ncbi:MAG: transcription termination/antitermination protein NusG [Lachnospiraceae bacterium]|nr:transcription termination/antitermination protein NusG [Lachnospiraceae bacterium]
MSEANWYVVHTYSGYENKVKANIEKTIENRHLEEEILEVKVPMQNVQETKNGVTKQTQKKLFPGYVLVHMVMNDDTWYVVRNTRGVTGFVGPGSKPVMLEPSELKALGIGGGKTEEAPKPKIIVDIEKGDMVVVVAGPWEGTDGPVISVNTQKQSVTINVDIFGRATPVEIGFADVKKK